VLLISVVNQFSSAGGASPIVAMNLPVFSTEFDRENHIFTTVDLHVLRDSESNGMHHIWSIFSKKIMIKFEDIIQEMY